MKYVHYSELICWQGILRNSQNMGGQNCRRSTLLIKHINSSKFNIDLLDFPCGIKLLPIRWCNMFNFYSVNGNFIADSYLTSE